MYPDNPWLIVFGFPMCPSTLANCSSNNVQCSKELSSSIRPRAAKFCFHILSCAYLDEGWAKAW